MKEDTKMSILKTKLKPQRTKGVQSSKKVTFTCVKLFQPCFLQIPVVQVCCFIKIYIETIVEKIKQYPKFYQELFQIWANASKKEPFQ